MIRRLAAALVLSLCSNLTACGVDDRGELAVAEPGGGGRSPSGGDGGGADANDLGSKTNGGRSGSGLVDGQGGAGVGPGLGGVAGAGDTMSGAGGTTPGAGGTTSGAGGSTGPLLGGCEQQLIANADFDLGPTVWTEVAERRDVIVHRDDAALIAAGVTPHSGEYLAWLGGIANGEFGQKYDSTVSQDVAIPAEATTLTLSGYVWVVQPQLGNNPFDWAVLELIDNNGVPDGTFEGQWQARAFGDDDAGTAGWTYFEATTQALDGLRGQIRTFVADSRPDGGGSLNVWLDSLRLEARCEQ